MTPDVSAGARTLGTVSSVMEGAITGDGDPPDIRVLGERPLSRTFDRPRDV